MNSGRAPEPLHAQDIHQNSCPTGMQGQVALRPVALRPVALDELIGADHLQIAAEAGFGLIVGVMVGTSGADQDALDPMHRQVAASLKRVAPNWLVDGGYVSRHGIEQVSRRGSRIYAPLGTLASQGSTAVQAWRERMNTADGRARYRGRAQTIEWVNACLRNRGLIRLNVRGQARVRAVALRHAPAHDATYPDHLRQLRSQR